MAASSRSLRGLVHVVFSFLAAALAVALVLGTSPRQARAAEPLDPRAVPEQLRPWTGWVLHGKAAATCAAVPDASGNDVEHPCAWPSSLDVTVDDKGGRFAQRWHVEAKQWVPLPGGERRWPLDVKVGTARAVVVAISGVPSVELSPGDHTIVGSFAWDSPPESLQVPPATGLLSLTLRGAHVPSPNRDASGVLWLQKTASRAEGEKLELVVHRKATDDVPLLLTTRIELEIAGKSREVLLGKALPSGFVPVSLDSPIPARLEPDGRLRVQARAGSWKLVLGARSEGPVDELRRPSPDGPWREGDEVWVFEARPDVRIVNVEGVPSIDPQQTTLPDDWKRLPAYPMKLGDTMRLAQRRRGDADPPPDRLTLTRNLWLDFDGAGYTASDTISGTLHRDARLEMAPPTVLGRVAIGGKNQFITHLDDPDARGVEVRQGPLALSADSRIPDPVGDIPTVGWRHDFHQVSGTLHLPPGFRLLHASGVDDVPETWLHHWSLFELFLALVIALAIGRLFGIGWGALALLMLALTFPEAEAPKWTWVTVLVAEALARALPKGMPGHVLRVVRLAALVPLALVAVTFLASHVREGMYPALAERGATASGGMLGDDLTLAKPAEAPPPPMQIGAAGSAGAPTGAPALSEPEEEEQDAPKLQAADTKARGQSAPPTTASPWSTVSQSGFTRGAQRKEAYADKQSNAQVYDPNAVVQTGPGLPTWTWTRVSLRWSGPVDREQQLRLFLLSPAENRALAFVRAALLLLVLLRLLPWVDTLLPPRFRSASPGKFTPPPARPSGSGAVPPLVGGAAALAFLFASLFATTAHAQTPPKEMLDELERRLLAKPACTPNCASSSRMRLEAKGRTLRARLDIDAAADTAVALPGSAAQWVPERVMVDGKPASALRRASGGSGKLFVLLAPGAHQVLLEGALPEREMVQLPLPLKPHRVEAVLEGWMLEGLHEDGLADDNLQLTRIQTTGAAEATLQPGTLPPFVRVERTLRLGLNWQVDTRVVRVSPLGSAVVLEVPLLPGESITTADVRIAGGKALVNMGSQATEVAWHSVLEQKSPLLLVAPKGLAETEVWRLDLGPIWHATPKGIPVVHASSTGGEGAARMPEWRPWPGESVTLDIVRPSGVPGQSLTIDRTDYELRPGMRATDATLTIFLRASRGLPHTVTLPEGAALESVSVNGVTQPIRQEGRSVTLPVVPGNQTIKLGWRDRAGVSLVFRTPEVDLGAPSVNTRLTVSGLGSRWILFAGGPRLGPAILFWSLLVVLLVVSALLARVRWVPLATWQWMLLTIGLSQVPIVAGAVVVGWLVALGWRKRRPEIWGGAWMFDLRQVAIALWTVTALVILTAAVHQGLLGAPDMQIEGNGSHANALVWYADRAGNVPAGAWVVSVPILVYRGAMLVWALWIAIAMLGWLRWGWDAFTTEGIWRAAKKPAAHPPPPPVAPMPPMPYGHSWGGPPGAPPPQGPPPGSDR